MARSYGQIMSAIWNDPDFRRLTGAAQRVYLMLITQADISSAGAVSLTVRRWSQYASDTDPSDLSEDITELAERRFIVVDFDTEELLVRKFVKWDGGYANRPRRLAIIAAANVVVSQRIRGVLAFELSNLDIDHGLCDAPREAPSYAPYEAPYEAPRVVVTEVSTTTTHNPEPQPATLKPSAGADAAIVRPEVDRLCELLADLIEGNGSKRPVVTARWRTACRLMLDADKRTEAQIEKAMRWCQADEFWRPNILSMPKLREKYDQLRLAAQRAPVAARVQTGTDDKIAATLAMGQRFADQGNYAAREITR